MATADRRRVLVITKGLVMDLDSIQVTVLQLRGPVIPGPFAERLKFRVIRSGRH